MTATRTYSSEAFNRLPFRDQLEILYGVSARDKRDLIVASPDAQRLVRSFAAESLFHTIKELGLEDAADLLALASGEQVCAMLDLDCWKKDRLSTLGLLDWLEAIQEGGDRALGEFLNAVDLPLLVLFLKRFIRVHRVEDSDEPPDPAGPEIFELDEHYRIEFHRWDARAPLVRRLIESLHERDYSYFVTVMEDVWWAVESELEETSFQFRNARLQDRGFPDYYEALEVYRPLATDGLPRRATSLASRNGGDSVLELPLERSIVIPEDARSFFAEVLNQGFHDESAAELRQEMAFLANRVMVAEGIDYADREAVGEAVRLAHDTVNLVLEHLSGGDLHAGVAFLERHYLQHLFRCGWGLLLDLRRRARAVADALGRAAAGGEAAFLDTPYREALAGCLRPRPRYFQGLDQPGEIRYRTFGAAADLELFRSLLDDLDALPALCERLLQQPLEELARLRPGDVDDFRLSAAFLTGFARLALGGGARLEPLALEELHRLREATAEPGTSRVRGELRARFLESAGERPGFLEFCLRRFEDEFLPIDPRFPPDPRFVTCLMIRAGTR